MMKVLAAILALASQNVSAWAPRVVRCGRAVSLQAEKGLDRRSWLAVAAVVAAPAFANAEFAMPELSEEEVS
jgi:hypothetical protein